MNAPAAFRIDAKARPLFRPLEPLAETPPVALSHFRLMVAMLLFMLATLVIAGRLVQLCLFSGKGKRDRGRGGAAARRHRRSQRRAARGDDQGLVDRDQPAGGAGRSQRARGEAGGVVPRA